MQGNWPDRQTTDGPKLLWTGSRILDMAGRVGILLRIGRTSMRILLVEIGSTSRLIHNTGISQKIGLSHMTACTDEYAYCMLYLRFFPLGPNGQGFDPFEGQSQSQSRCHVICCGRVFVALTWGFGARCPGPSRSWLSRRIPHPGPRDRTTPSPQVLTFRMDPPSWWQLV